MRIEILGTAASEGIPALFCECGVCREAAKRGGKDIRTRTSLLIGEKHKVDQPPDTFLHSLRRGKPFSKVEHLFITHSHADHFYPESLRLRLEPFAYIKSARPLNIYGSETIRDIAEEALGRPLPDGLAFHEVELFRSFTAGEIDVLPVKAAHKANELCLNYVFTARGKKFLQAFDTGWYPDDTWDALSGLMLDVAIIECTAGKLDEPPTSHLNVEAVLRMRNELIERRTLRPDARVITTHFSHIGGMLYEELEEALSPVGIEVAYDGMIADV
jgi:phosphoribosyl 1,2-cyclic phosphate phosphodiesterase